MSQPFDLSQFPDLPPEVMKAFAAQSAALEAARFEASVERAARLHEQAVGAEKDAFITELTALIEKLEGQVGQYRHAKFGPKSEKLDPAQLELALEDLETAIAETQAQIAAVEEKIAASAADPDKAAPRAPRKARALPEHLPRIERVIEPDSITCPCGCGDMVPGRAAGLYPCTLSGDRLRSPQVCLSERKSRGGAGQGSGASAGGQLADRSAAGANRRVQAFRTHAAEPAGCRHGAAWCAD